MLLIVVYPCLISPLLAQAPVTKVWDKTFGGFHYDELKSMATAIDGGYLLGGSSKSEASGDKTEGTRGGYDFWVIKLNSDGSKAWDKTIGGGGDDMLKAMITLPDGGYLLGGWSESGIGGDKTESSKGGHDFWVVKINSDGSKAWDRTIGGSAWDEMNSLTSTSDGGYLLGGWSASDIGEDKTEINRGYRDFWIVKIDAEGTKVWDKTFGGGGIDELHGLTNTFDGGYVLGGWSASGADYDKTEDRRGYRDYWVVKVDIDGTKVWDRAYGGSGVDELYALTTSADGGYLLGGWSYSDDTGDKSEPRKGYTDFWMVKLNADGSKVWDKAIGGSGYDDLSSLISTEDGGFLVGGRSNGGNGDKSEYTIGYADYWAVKLDAVGNMEWEQTFKASGDEDILTSLTSVGGGNYLIGGYSTSGIGYDKSEASKGSRDYWVLKISTKEIVSLPVTWLSFEGRAIAEGNELNWATATEIETKSFLIERSIDGRTFSEIGQVPAAGNSTIKRNYKFLDQHFHIDASLLYYRIRQLDLDGKYEFSKVIALAKKAKWPMTKLRISPNPFVRNLTIYLDSRMVGKNGEVILSALDGREVYRLNFSPLLKEANTIMLEDLPELTPGVYLLRVLLDGNLNVVKLLRH